MSEELIRQIATDVARHMQPLGGWELYLVMIAVSLISVAATAGLGAYFRKRGETYATKADMNEILQQLRQTTRAAEETRSAVNHADWHAREWKTLRRVKLEELMEAINEAREQLRKEIRINLFSGDVLAPPSVWRMTTLANLYVPEMTAATASVAQSIVNYFAWAGHHKVQMLALRHDAEELQHYIDSQQIVRRGGEFEKQCGQAVAEANAHAGKIMAAFSSAD